MMDRDRSDKKRIWLDFVLIAGLIGMALFICMQNPSSIFSNDITKRDSSVFRYVAWEMTQGNMPYKDTFDHKGILVYVINYLGMLISFEHGIWVLEVAAVFTALFFGYLTMRLFSDRIPAFTSVVVVYLLSSVCLEGGNLTESWALPFFSVAFYLFTKYIVYDRIHKYEIMLCGACFAAVCLLKINMALVWGAFCLAVLIRLVKHKYWRDLVEYLLLFLSGILLMILPFIVFLAIGGALGDFVEQYILFNLQYSDVGHHEQYEAAKFFIREMNLSVMFVAFIGAYIVLEEHEKHKKELFWTYLGAASICFLTIIMPGNQFLHYALALLPILVYPMGCVVNTFYKTIRENGKEKSGAIVGIGCLIGILVIPCLFHGVDNMYAVMHGTEKGEHRKSISQIVKNNTKEGDYISVSGNADWCYLYSGRQSASKYSYLYPIASIKKEIWDEYFADLEEKRPKLIVVDSPDFMTERFYDFLKEQGYEILHEDKLIQIYNLNNNEK